MKRTLRKKILPWLLSAAMVLGLLPWTAFAASDPGQLIFDVSEGLVEITDSATVGRLKVTYGTGQVEDNINPTNTITLIGTTTGTLPVNITGCTTPVNITLNNVDITATNGAAIKLDQNCTATITLSGSNKLLGGGNNGSSGLYVGSSASVTIKGSGLLDTEGATFWAGIGGNGNTTAGGDAGRSNITIDSGTIIATGGHNGTGIGGSYGFPAGLITINGGTVIATGRGDSAGIGSGGMGIWAVNSIVTINGGMVTATGNTGIGVGHIGDHTNVVITGGSVNAAMNVQPTCNGTDPVYHNTLTVGSPAIAATAIQGGSVDGVSMSTTANASSGVYGINDVSTTSSGILHFWLPANSASNASVQVSTSSNLYQNIFSRGTAALAATLVEFTTIAPLSANHDFGSAQQGYTTLPTAHAVTIRNTGILAASNLAVSISGAGSSNFTLNTSSVPTSLVGGGTASFTVRPKSGLTAGTYTETVTLSGSNIVPQSFDVTFVVSHDAQTPNITTHPLSVTASQNGYAQLNVAASVTDGGTLSYLWYSSPDGITYTPISGATNSLYLPNTTSVGTTYYYAEVTNTNMAASGIQVASIDSTAATVSVSASGTAPQAQINFANEMLTNLVPSASYTIDGASFTADASGEIPFQSAWFGSTLTIVYTSGTPGSNTQTLAVPSRPADPAGLSGTDETAAGQNDGSIAGVNSTMEYSSDGGATWTQCPSGTITGLAAGTYQVRYEATSSAFTSTPATIVIGTLGTPSSALTVTALSFASQKVGYARPAAQPIVITNSGSANATISNVTASGTAFDVTGSGAAVPAGGSIQTWEIQPVLGLAVGTYAETITVTYDSGQTATATVTFTVTSAGGGGGGGGGGGSSTTYFTLSFETTGGTAISAAKKASGTTIALSQYVTTKTGYTFAGWYSDEALKTKVTSVKLTEDMTVYAKWEAEGAQTNPDTPSTTHSAYISGYTDGTFKPDGSITRAETAQLLYNVSDKDTQSTAVAFGDVSSGMWHYEAVSALSGSVISGYSDGTFRPDNNITRAEFITLVVKYKELTLGSSTTYSDVSQTHWAAGYIAAGKDAGYISGYADGTFRPDALITRAEAVTILNQMLAREAKESTFAGLTMPFSDVASSHWAYFEIMEAAVEHTH